MRLPYKVLQNPMAKYGRRTYADMDGRGHAIQAWDNEKA
jgi:hypothetical protein